MLTLVRPDDTMTTIARRTGMLRGDEELAPRAPRTLRQEFDRLSDTLKEAIEAEFSRRLVRGTADQMYFYPVLAEDALGEFYAA
jgi:hypothetical protein